MSKRSSLMLNFIGFQLAWFACVLSAANEKAYVGMIVVLIVLVLQLLLSVNRLRTLSLMLAISFLGASWDSFLTTQSILVFETGQMLPGMAPVWIIAMWLSFSTTVSISFRWLYSRYGLSALLGAVSGPLSYQAGAALGAVSIPNPIMANVYLALGWGLLMPVFIYLARWNDSQGAQGRIAHEY